jgi:hypothetical protein
MPYTIYVSDHCSDCVKVINYIRTSSLDCEVINVAQAVGIMPVHIFIVPALTQGEKLLAYGEQDILKILNQSSDRA